MDHKSPFQVLQAVPIPHCPRCVPSTPVELSPVSTCHHIREVPSFGLRVEMAADPTYPLYPIVCGLSVGMLLLVLLRCFIRQNWNFGVAVLSFWLALENLTSGINAILWADNADIKLHVYCDICIPIALVYTTHQTR